MYLKLSWWFFVRTFRSHKNLTINQTKLQICWYKTACERIHQKMSMLSEKQAFDTCKVWVFTTTDIYIWIMRWSHNELYNKTTQINRTDWRNYIQLYLNHDGSTDQIHSYYSVQRNLYSRTAGICDIEQINSAQQHFKKAY